MRDLEEIVAGAYHALRPGGFVALETGGGEQPRLVAQLLEEEGRFTNIKVVKDLAGIERHVSAFRSTT
eukprot:211951-Prorocentrum_minimum.AAC.1